jgi:23S rRNA (uracil1939-C5)-methyltransferase
METLKEGCVESCPGCSHRSMTMQESLDQKEGWIRKKLVPWNDIIETIRSADEAGRWEYRSKILLHARFQDNHWNFGMMRRDVFIAIPDCPVHSVMTRKLISLLTGFLPPENLFPLAFLFQSDALVTLVLKTKILPSTAWFTEAVAFELQSIGIQGLSIHLNPSAGRRMFAKDGWYLIRGKDHTVNQADLWYGRTSFSQLILSLHMQSLDEAESFLGPGANDCVTDLYCGIGSSLVRWIRRGALAIGVETGGEAVACAIQNAPGALVLRGTCQQRIPQLQQWLEVKHRSGHKKLLYANPPRTGIEEPVLKWITMVMKPDRIAYLSCSAGTLKRDLDAMITAGYEIVRIIPYDFFPQTYHVECLVLVEKSSVKL